MIRFLAVLLSLLLLSERELTQPVSQSAVISKYFSNPLFDGADPWMIQKDGYYYFCFSSGNSISIRRSQFITKPGETRKVWEAPASGWNRSCVWAPELHFFDGRWYIYYAAGESGPPYIHQKTGVLQSATEDPFSRYTDIGMLYTGDNPDLKSDNVWAIDLTVFTLSRQTLCGLVGMGETSTDGQDIAASVYRRNGKSFHGQKSQDKAFLSG